MISKEPHIQDYIQVILRRRWIMIAFFIVLVTTVFIGSIKQTPIYEAVSLIRIENKTPQVVSIKEVSAMGLDGSAHKDYYETQYKLLKSRALLTKVANALGMKSGNPHPGSDPARKLQGMVDIKPVRNTQLVQISAKSPSPKMAAKIANTVAREFIGQNLERNVNAAAEAAKWLAQKIEEQREKFRASEWTFQKYREENNIRILPELTGASAIGNIKSEYARLHAQLANYSQRYTDVHPKIIELKAQIQSLRNKIYGLEDVKAGDKTMEYKALERDVQSNKRIYDILLTRLKEIDLSGSLDVNNISIIDSAQVPFKPIKPNVKRDMMLAVMVGLIGGVGLSFFADYLDTTIKSSDDVKEILGAYFLGAICNIVEEEDEVKKDTVMHSHSRSVVSESYRNIRTEICRLLADKSGPKTILITSAEPQGGKTITASNLGIAFSQKHHKVILVDCDLRKPQLAKIFNISESPGLSEYLKGKADVNSIIKDTGIKNMMVIPSGKIPSNPSECIGTEKMKELIKELKKKFDFTFFDTPPVVSVTDAVILADMVDAAIQVVRSGKDFVPIAQRTREKLVNVKAAYLGVILNGIKNFHDYYYYYQQYHDYIQDGKKQKKPAKSFWEQKDKLKYLNKAINKGKDNLKANLKKVSSLVRDKFNRKPR